MFKPDQMNLNPLQNILELNYVLRTVDKSHGSLETTCVSKVWWIERGSWYEEPHKLHEPFIAFPKILFFAASENLENQFFLLSCNLKGKLHSQEISMPWFMLIDIGWVPIELPSRHLHPWNNTEKSNPQQLERMISFTHYRHFTSTL